ncbi:MAG: N-acetyl-alpha-D-glucosaminyl L-malate synthase BshA [Bacteroidia bacterium]
MKIGIVCYPTYGGSGVLATELGKSLASRGHQVHFITYSRPIRLGHFVQNILFHEVRVEDYPLFEYPPYESALTSTMVDVGRYQNLDLFHVHYAIPHASAAVLARNILADMGKRVPVITTLHGTDITLVGKEKSFEPVVAHSINQSDGVTAVSEYLRQATLDTFPIRRDIEVVPNFVDTNRFQRQDKEHFRRLVAPNNEKLIIHASNFRKVKRVGDVIRTFALIRSQVRSKLLMVGDGPERSNAEALCRELHLCDDVVFLGNQNPVEELYSIGDLFLLPSETESFGLAALEAMACGIPCITSDSGGLPEVMKNGETGFVVGVSDVEGMAARSIEILNDPAIWKAFSENSIVHASGFDIEKVVPLYEQYYQRVLEQQPLPVR